MARFGVVLGSSLALAACATTAGRGPAAPSPERQARVVIVERAQAMLGQPYRYGGAAPGGFDCSGLVTYAADGAGIRLPRTAAEQYRTGKPIARVNIEAGDLVFMRLTHKDMHVGIALDADRFIHAPAGGRRVRIDSLAAPPYAHAFLAARRIVDAGATRAFAIQSTPAISPVH
jgi:cell wall-associated NlpC family hydrolase